ncbi:ABC transporter ATP-binding protein [Pseudoglutamicibacter albus]|uniref:ABC-2 type transport system ATP-binding protein n=1 Tax=Pseudoglutamicibacter albus TaxID=98671 RepID=A0ABU1YWT7_9MICC|nr:ABC transporter ATP-binding protein [Pseudoglutamicibacter albus]MDR7292820.1 ABC-2 type transport system ATP-binding protein [Pseudoglutamicibacter albus]
MILDIHQLTRRFGNVTANDSVSLQVRAGQLSGLLGHNGAGKTTLVSQIVGLLRPDSGSLHVAGIDATRRPALARRAVALQTQSTASLDGLTPRLAITLAARLRGLSARDSRAASARLLDELDLGPWADRAARPEGGGLSGGVRRLTTLAMALAAPVPLLVLDEPTNDVDAARRRLLWSALRRRADDDGTAVLVVTHNVNEAESVVDELTVLDRGRVVASGSPAQLRARALGEKAEADAEGAGRSNDTLRLTLRLPGEPEPAPTDAAAEPRQEERRREEPHREALGLHLPEQLEVRGSVVVGRRVILTLPASRAGEAVAWSTGQRAAGVIEDYTLGPASLEDAYLALTAPKEETLA